MTELNEYEARLTAEEEIPKEELAAIVDDLMRRFAEHRKAYQRASSQMDNIGALLRQASLRNPVVYREAERKARYD
jgi:hypothetical protein